MIKIPRNTFTQNNSFQAKWMALTRFAKDQWQYMWRSGGINCYWAHTHWSADNRRFVCNSRNRQDIHIYSKISICPIAYELNVNRKMRRKGVHPMFHIWQSNESN